MEWTPIVVAVVVLIGTLVVGYWQFGRKAEPKPPGQGDRALDEIFERLERLEREHADVLRENTLLQVERERLRGELRQARLLHETDSETIARLRAEIGMLERLTADGS